MLEQNMPQWLILDIGEAMHTFDEETSQLSTNFWDYEELVDTILAFVGDVATANDNLEELYKETRYVFAQDGPDAHELAVATVVLANSISEDLSRLGCYGAMGRFPYQVEDFLDRRHQSVLLVRIEEDNNA